MIKQYTFYKTKYGNELLIDLILLEDLQPYIAKDPTHTLTYYDITLISNGQGTFSIDRQQFAIEKGRVFFSSPGQVRNWHYNHIPRGYVLIFEEEFLNSFFNDSRFVQNLLFFNGCTTQPSIIVTPAEYSQLEKLMQNIRNEICHFRFRDKHILRALLYQALTILNRMYQMHVQDLRTGTGNRHIVKFTNLVSTHFRDIRNVGFYARELNITTGHLNQLVKQHSGISAKQCILNRAMLEAKSLLSYTQLSVDEIAVHLHYESTSYFIRAFHKNTGMTPLRFRKSETHEK